MSWLSDSVYSIREAATVNLKKLTEVFGAEWCEKNLLPKILSMQHSNYLYRMTTLFAINSLVVVLPHDLNSKDLLDMVIKMLEDPVPNVRFNAVKTLEIMMNNVKTQVIKDKIKPTLTEMSSKEKDTDVKFFISQALSKC
jgi:serine/threonine-protein phosphatase 2A regulatory subunit A